VNASVDDLGIVTWSIDFSKVGSQGFSENGYPIAVGCLRSNSTIPSSECAATVSFLSSVGITSADYPHILGADPFADPNAPPTPDPNRYVVFTSVGYLPDPVLITYGANNSATAANTQVSTYSYSVGATVSASYDGMSLKDPTTFTWTNSSAPSNQTGTTANPVVWTAMPAAPDSAPTTLFVYLDTIYKTFMFSFNH